MPRRALTEQELAYLHKLIPAGSATARKLNRARILLKADVGKHAEGEAFSDRQIAQMLETSTATVQRARERFYEGGLEAARSEEHTSELQSRQYLVCRLLLEKKTIGATHRGPY